MGHWAKLIGTSESGAHHSRVLDVPEANRNTLENLVTNLCYCKEQEMHNTCNKDKTNASKRSINRNLSEICDGVDVRLAQFIGPVSCPVNSQEGDVHHSVGHRVEEVKYLNGYAADENVYEN